MRSTSKTTIIEHLSFLADKTAFTLERTKEISCANDFLCTPGGMDLFDATIMRLQVVGEILKQIDVATSGNLLKHYPEIPWRSVFGLRNIISHEYASVDPAEIINILRNHLPPLLVVLYRILDNLKADKHDILFE